MITVRRHLVTVTYSDYGSHLDTVYRTATSVDGCRPVCDGPERRMRRDAEKDVLAWLSDHEGRSEHVTCERGEDVERVCDINPHGLI